MFAFILALTGISMGMFASPNRAAVMNSLPKQDRGAGGGMNQHLLGAHVLAGLSAHSRATVTGQAFFPHLISAPFRSGLREAFAFAIIACLVAAALR